MLRSGWARFQTPYSTEAMGLAKRGLVFSLDLPPLTGHVCGRALRTRILVRAI
jgi:hypothetical protein